MSINPHHATALIPAQYRISFGTLIDFEIMGCDGIATRLANLSVTLLKYCTLTQSLNM